MEERIYKGRPWVLIKEFVLLACAAIVLTMILSIFLEWVYVLGIVGVIVVVFAISTINDKRQSVIVTDQSVRFRKGNKEESYQIAQCYFGSRTDNSGLYLFVTDAQGKEHKYDVSMLGASQFQRCIQDIGIIGEKAKAIRLQVKGGEE